MRSHHHHGLIDQTASRTKMKKHSIVLSLLQYLEVAQYLAVCTCMTASDLCCHNLSGTVPPPHHAVKKSQNREYHLMPQVWIGMWRFWWLV